MTPPRAVKVWDFFDFKGILGEGENRWVDTQNGLMVMNGAESSGGVCYFCCALLKLGFYIVCVSSLSLSIYLCQCMRFQKLPIPSKYTTKAALIQPTIRPTTRNPNPTRMFEHFGKWLANWVTAYNPFAYRFWVT